MFQTGRTDCDPKAGANTKHQYLSGKKEVHPNQHGNGNDSVIKGKSCLEKCNPVPNSWPWMKIEIQLLVLKGFL